MTDQEAREKGLPGSDVYMRSHLAYKDAINNSAFFAYLNGQALLAFKSTISLNHHERVKQEGDTLQQWFSDGAQGVLPPSPYTMATLEYNNLENLLMGSGFELHLKAEQLVRDTSSKK